MNELTAERAMLPAPEVKSENERIAEREATTRASLRMYSLIRMCRASKIRRSIPRQCKCGRPISANKSACLRCAAK